MRIDKFLKVSRILKRRTVAQEACSEEKVLINGKAAKPSTAVKIGDVVEVLYASGVLKFRILNIKETVKKEDPKLIEIADNVFKDIQTFYKNSNNLKMENGMLPKTMKTSRKFAKEQMGLSEKDVMMFRDSEGNINVNTADYLSAMNPYYFKTERDVEWYTNPVSYQEPNISVRGNKGLKEGASRHAIFSIFDSMSSGAINDRVAIRHNALYQDVAKAVGKGVKIEQATTTEGNKIFIPADEGKYSMRYYVDGKLKTSLVSNEIYKTLGRNETIFDLFGDTTVGKGTKALNKFRRDVLTTFNPGFLVRNTAMDYQDAVLNSNYGVVQYNKNYIKALKEISTNSKEFQKFTIRHWSYSFKHICISIKNLFYNFTLGVSYI